jgi:hypothetical protein
MGAHYPLCDAKSKPAAINVAAMGRIASIKAVEDAREFFGRDSRTCIANKELAEAIVQAQINGDHRLLSLYFIAFSVTLRSN